MREQSAKEAIALSEALTVTEVALVATGKDSSAQSAGDPNKILALQPFSNSTKPRGTV